MYDSTVGLAREYQRKTLELARITAATYYLQAVNAVRHAAIALFVVFVATVVFSVAVVVVPIVLVLLGPWTLAWKIAAVALLGLLDIAGALVIMANIFSEERWIRVTKAQEFVDKIKNPL